MLLINTKKLILNKFIEQLTIEAEALKKGALLAHSDAISCENVAENKYDTRALEASYLAKAQSKLAVEAFENIHIYQSLVLKEFNSTSVISLSALVELKDSDDTHSLYFIGPKAGGICIEIDNQKITLISIFSPLGSALLGKEIGDIAEIIKENIKVQYEIISIT
jgi:transcription elongation GreA/GreB family factor